MEFPRIKMEKTEFRQMEMVRTCWKSEDEMEKDLKS